MAYDLQDFDAQVVQRSHEVPVLVDFWSPHCGPCLMFAPILEGMAEQADGKWDLVKVNTMEHPEIASQFDVNGIPDIRIFKDGEVVEQFLGMRGEDEVEHLLKKHIPSPHAAQLAEARSLLQAKDFAKAAVLLESLDDKEEGAWFLLAQAYLAVAPAKVPEACKPLPYGSDYVEPANALQELATLVQNLNSLPEAPPQASFEAGLRAIQNHDFPAAFEAFIEVLREDPAYADHGAATACRAMVGFLGIRDEVADKYQRIFASLVYS